jgi:hypothetical protein
VLHSIVIITVLLILGLTFVFGTRLLVLIFVVPDEFAEFHSGGREPLSERKEHSFEVACVTTSSGDTYQDMVIALVDGYALVSEDWVVHGAHEEEGSPHVLQVCDGAALPQVLLVVLDALYLGNHLLGVGREGVDFVEIFAHDALRIQLTVQFINVFNSLLGN